MTIDAAGGGSGGERISPPGFQADPPVPKAGPPVPNSNNYNF
jgi:hypothetical protein